MIGRNQVQGNGPDGTISTYAQTVAEQTIRETQAVPDGKAAVFSYNEVITLIAYAVSMAERDLY